MLNSEYVTEPGFQTRQSGCKVYTCHYPALLSRVRKGHHVNLRGAEGREAAHYANPRLGPGPKARQGPFLEQGRSSGIPAQKLKDSGQELGTVTMETTSVVKLRAEPVWV